MSRISVPQDAKDVFMMLGAKDIMLLCTGNVVYIKASILMHAWY